VLPWTAVASHDFRRATSFAGCRGLVWVEKEPGLWKAGRKVILASSSARGVSAPGFNLSKGIETCKAKGIEPKKVTMALSRQTAQSCIEDDQPLAEYHHENDPDNGLFSERLDSSREESKGNVLLLVQVTCTYGDCCQDQGGLCLSDGCLECIITRASDLTLVHGPTQTRTQARTEICLGALNERG